MSDNPKPVPSLYKWLGEEEKLQKLTSLFYKKVLQDELLEPLFRNMPKDHPSHVAHFIGEVFGGPKTYSEQEGSHYKMVSKHIAKHISEEQRQRWIQLLLQTADEIGLPDDPEFRSALLGYLEWGTRIAKLNSNTDAIEMHESAPMPKWGWGEVGGPYEG